jgi:glycosyltransferase involved in cell wall biosynthesis
LINQTIRILQFVPEGLPNHRADVTVLFGKYLPRHGVTCDIVGRATKEPLKEQGFASVQRPPMHGSRLRQELSFSWLGIRRLFQARRDTCDVIQVRDMVFLAVIGLLISRLRGIPLVYWMSFLMWEGRIDRARTELARRPSLRYRLLLLKGLVERWLLYSVVAPRCDHLFVQSQWMKNELARQGVDPAKMSPVPMGVDTELLGTQPQPRRPVGWEEGPLIGYLGTLDQSRQLEQVVDALHLVRQRYPAARLLLVGDSPTRSDVDKLLAYAASLGLGDAVKVTGWLPSAEAWSLIAGTDLAVSYVPRGSLYDISSPTKLLEYMALNLPCVANDNPDQADVLTRSGAGWLTASSGTAMGEAMIAILDDPAAAAGRAGCGLAFIDAHRSYRVIAAELAGQYRAIRA